MRGGAVLAMSRILVLVVAALLLAAPAAAQRVALVIGNGAYAAAPRLPNPTNDARGVAASLGRLGFRVDLVVDAGRARMEEALRRFARASEGAEIALLFFAGHGLQIRGENWLVPTDARLADARDAEFELIGLDMAMRQMEGARARVLIVDACRDNPLASRMRGLGGTRSLGRGLASVEARDVGTLIAFSTAPGTVAADGSGPNSPFTAALLQHLETPGAELQAIMRRVRQSVVAATGGRQVPWDNSSLSEEIVLRPAAPSAPAAPPPVAALPAAPSPARGTSAAADVAFWESVRDTGSAEELRAYLAQFPNGQFAGLARLRLERLEGRGARQAGAAAVPAAPAPAPPPAAAAAPVRPVPASPAPPPPRAPAGAVAFRCPPAGQRFAFEGGAGLAWRGPDPADPEVCLAEGGGRVQRLLFAMYELPMAGERATREGLRGLFPLEPGRTARFPSYITLSDQADLYNESWRVLRRDGVAGREAVVVQRSIAGVFARPARGGLSLSVGDEAWTETLWWDAASGGWLRREVAVQRGVVRIRSFSVSRIEAN